MQSVDQACSAMQSGSFAPSDTSAHRLVSASVPCKRIRLIAPVDALGIGTNTRPVFFGDSAHQYDWIAIDGSRDCYVHLNDAFNLYVKLGNSADTINYRIEK